MQMDYICLLFEPLKWCPFVSEQRADFSVRLQRLCLAMFLTLQVLSCQVHYCHQCLDHTNLCPLLSTCYLLFLWITPLVSQIKPPFLRIVFPELSLPSSFPPSASPGHIVLPDPHSIITTYSLHLHMRFIVSFLDLLLDSTKEGILSVLFITAYSNYNRVIAP